MSYLRVRVEIKNNWKSQYCDFQLDDAKCDFQPTKLKNILEVIEQKMLSDEGSNSVQRQPQRLKAFAKILQNILSAKDLQIT